MYLTIIFVYIYNVFLSFFLSRLNKKYIYFLCLPLIIFLSWFGANNIKKISVDYENYSNWISDIFYTEKIDFFLDKDPGFALLVKGIQYLFGNEYFYIYFIFIFLGVFSKLKLAVDWLPNTLIALFLVLCLSRYYIIHDVTQLRAGLVIVLGTLLSLNFINKNINIVWYSVFLVALSSIHSSIILLLLIMILDYSFKFLKKRYFTIIVFFSSLFSYFIGGLITEKASVLFGGYFRYSVYLETGGFEDAKISIFSFFILIKIMIVLMNIIIWEKINDFYRVLVSLSCIGLFFALAFSQIAVLGWRFSEIFAYFDILCIFTPLIFLKLDINARFLYIIFWFVMSFLMLYSSLVVILNI